MKVDAVYVNYWSLRDPLCQSQTLPVLRGLAARGWRFGLITFEQPPWRLRPEERARRAKRLLAEGILWHPLAYHRRPPLLSTAYDILRGSLACLSWRRRGPRLLHGRGSVAAAVAYLGSRLLRCAFFNDADGPLSQEYVDAGIWAGGSLAHHCADRAERLFLKASDVTAVLTERRREEVATLSSGPVIVLPCAVDTELFEADPSARSSRRAELGVTGTLLVYAGKFGGWYLGAKVVEFAAAARDVIGDVTLLVLTTESGEAFEASARRLGVELRLRQSTRAEMPHWLSAADAGLSLILSSPSKRACSPIKNGEYLACGLPLVTTPGIGDYSELVARRRVGVVVRSLDRDGLTKAAADLVGLLQDPALATRCRAAAIGEVGVRGVVLPRYEAAYVRLLARPAAHGGA